MKSIWKTLFILILIAFLGIAILGHFKAISDSTANNWMTIIGGLASLIGLWSLVKPGISHSDMKIIRTDALEEILQIEKELKRLEGEKAKTSRDVIELNTAKKELDTSVRKICLSIFLTEQRRLFENRVQDLIKNSTELQSSLSSLAKIDHDMRQLELEISTDPNIAKIQSIIESHRRRMELKYGIEIDPAFPFLSFFDIYAGMIKKILTRRPNKK